MKKSATKIISMLTACLMILPLAVSCGKSGKDTAGTSSTVTSEVTQEPVGALSPEIQENKYASAGLELMLNVIDDYYTERTNWLKSTLKTNASGASAVWGVGSFIEALAETYRIYPDNAEVKRVYEDALTELLDNYKVTNANVVTPNTGRHTVTYYNAVRSSSGDFYYDDNAWICIQLLEAYKLLQDESYLEAAKANLDFLWTGWDDELGGGIYWDKTYKGKNTCANGPVAIAFLTAYQITKEQQYLDRGKAIYDWANAKLLDGNLYIDNISLDGNSNNWKAAYNQGTMIYVGSQLFEITGEEQYYTRTKNVVNATVNLMFKTTGRGDSMRATMNGNPIYKSWCIGWLTRGFIKYYEVDTQKAEKPMQCLELVLDNELKTKNKDGYYDPYFLSGDWGSEDALDILQPSGVASVFCLAAYFDEVVKDAA